MTSKINTNGIDTNYPIPGVNNSTQGFRDNFAQISGQLTIAGEEITALQNSVVVKSALPNVTINNDMANTLISNAAIRGFRETTYNLGNALAGTVRVNVNAAGVQFGSITENVTLQFGGWSPVNTKSEVTLRLTIANTDATISLPNNCISTNNNFGVTLLENYANTANVATLTAPANTSILEYTFSSIDCGNTIAVEPTNRPYQSTQIQNRTPPSTGLPGDTVGTVSIGEGFSQITATATANVPTVITANAAVMNSSTISGTTLTVGTLASGTITVGMLLSGGAVAANTYIVSNLSGSGSGSTWVVSQSQSLGSTNLTGRTGIVTYSNNVPILTVGVQTSGTVQEGMILSGSGVTANTVILENISGSGSGSVWRVSDAQYAAPTSIGGNIDVITVSATSELYRDVPIVFTGTTFGGITAGNVYYVKDVCDANSITISSTPGGAQTTLSNASGTMYGNPLTYMYVSTNDYDSTSYEKTVTNTYVTTNTIKLSGTANLAVNAPIIFSGNVFGGLEENTVYYIKSIDSGNANITVSQTRYNGVAGSVKLLTTANGTATCTAYVEGSDIWKRTTLSPW